MSSEWPKPWNDITSLKSEDIETDLVSNEIAFGDTWMEYQDGVRGYEATLYVSESVGRETEENVDKWMPFEVYIAQKS